MLITRLDAYHPAGDGVFCVLFQINCLDRYAHRLRSCGWEVDVYQEDVGQISEEQAEFLCSGYWPLVPTSTLLEWFPRYPSPAVDSDEVFVPAGGAS